MLRYLQARRLDGSRSSGRWRVTAIALWRHLGVEDEMLRVWRDYCLAAAAEREKPQ